LLLSIRHSLGFSKGSDADRPPKSDGIILL
jgi:hypothetical protein